MCLAFPWKQIDMRRTQVMAVLLLTGAALVSSAAPPTPPLERFTAPLLEGTSSFNSRARATTSFAVQRSTTQPQETLIEFGRKLPPSTNTDEVEVDRNEGFLLGRRSRNQVDRLQRKIKKPVSPRPMRKLNNLRRSFRQDNQNVVGQVINERPQRFDVFVQTNNAKSLPTPEFILPNRTVSNKQLQGIGNQKLKGPGGHASTTVQIFSAEEDDNEEIIILDDNGNLFRSDSLEVVEITRDNALPNPGLEISKPASTGLSKLLFAEKQDNSGSSELEVINFPKRAPVDDNLSFEGIDFDFDDHVDDDLFDFDYDDFSSLEVPSSFIQQSFSTPTRAPSPPATKTPLKVIVVVENNSTHATVQIPSKIMRDYPRQVQALIRRIKADIRNEKKLETGSKDRRISQSHQQHMTFTKTNHASFDETVGGAGDLQNHGGYTSPRPAGRGASSYSTSGQASESSRRRFHPQRTRKHRNRTGTSKNMYKTDQTQRADAPGNENSGYQFEYEVSEDEVQFGHAENRSGNTVHGEYHVLLPNGFRQIVTYYADETGYHPTIRYEPPIVLSPRKVIKKPSSRHGVPLTFSDNQYSDSRPSASQDAPKLQEKYRRPPVDSESQHPSRLPETYRGPPVASESQDPSLLSETYRRPPVDSESEDPSHLPETYRRPPVATELQGPSQLQETYRRPPVALELQGPSQLQETYRRPPVALELQGTSQLQETYRRPPVALELQGPSQLQETYRRPPVALESATANQGAAGRDTSSTAQSFAETNIQEDDKKRDQNSLQNDKPVIPHSNFSTAVGNIQSLQYTKPDDTTLGQSITQSQNRVDSKIGKQTRYSFEVNENSQENTAGSEKYKLEQQEHTDGKVFTIVDENHQNKKNNPFSSDSYTEPRLSQHNSSNSDRITTVGRAIDSFEKGEEGLMSSERDRSVSTTKSVAQSVETPVKKTSYTIIMNFNDEPADTKLSIADRTTETVPILKDPKENQSHPMEKKISVLPTTESAGIKLPILSAKINAADKDSNAKAVDSDQQTGDFEIVADHAEINLITTSKSIEDENSTQTKRNAAPRNYRQWVPTIRHPAYQTISDTPHIQSSLRQYSVGPTQQDETPPSANQYTIDSSFWNTNKVDPLPSEVPYDRSLRKTSTLYPSALEYSIGLKRSDTKQSDRKKSEDSWQVFSGELW